MKAVSNEIREKIIIHKQNKVRESDIANWLLISQSTVTKVWARYRKTTSYLPSPVTQGRKPVVSESTMRKVVEEIKKTPDVTLSELIDKFDLRISECALSKRLKKLGFSYKKRQLIQPHKIEKMYRKSAEYLENT